MRRDDRRRSQTTKRVGENPRPPRYRLLAAAAALPQRESVRASLSFERECPFCGQVVTFTQVEGGDYTVAEHNCVEV